MKVIKILFVLFMMVTIFMFSNQSSNESQALSEKVLYKTDEVINNKKVNENEKKDLSNNYNTLIRKIAHFSLYFILGISVYLLLKDYIDKRLVLYTILICFIYAISDEVHQLFIPGRAFQVLDIIIDTCGSIISILFMKLLKK